MRVLDRLAPRAGERILDIGCGTGRLTAEIRRRAPDCHVVGSDRSSAMLQQARIHFATAARYVQADGMFLPLADALFDAVFSTATFHWIPDHERLFAEVHRVLKPGARLVSQAGGGPNLQHLYARARELRESPPYGRYFTDWRDPWTFAGTADTEHRLRQAGFEDVRVWLEPAPIRFADVPAYEEFVTTVCLRHHLDRLPDELRGPFVHDLAARAAGDDPPLTLDYWRLNADARRG